MKMLRAILLILSLLLLPTTLWAKTVVLIHGFQGTGMDWRKNGVTPPLQQNGWVDAGNLTPFYTPSHPAIRPSKVFYTVDLPSRAPLLQQAQWLNAYLHAIYAQRQEPLTLVGHSAGGVVARTWLVVERSVPVETLVTIATPNLGTPTANLAAMATDTPMAWFMGNMPGMGKWLDDPATLYDDLRVEQPGRFLYWLNHQPHPAIRYAALVRDSTLRPDKYDFVVPRDSQNLNNVYALRGQAEYWEVKDNHFLGVADGYALAMLLSR